MQKVIRDVDEKRGIVQVTVSDERWYLKPSVDQETKLPVYKAVPSSTWIAGYYPKGIAFYKWLAEHGWDEAEAIKNAAAERGSKVHKAIESILRGEEVRMDSKFVNPRTGQEEELTIEECDAILSFVDWKKEVNPKSICWEVTVFSDKHNYAGTVDYICEINGELWVIDFKTSQHIWASHELQVSSYGQVIRTGEHDITAIPTPKDAYYKAPKMAILQLGYRLNKRKFKFTEIEDKFHLFLAAQTMWANENTGKEPSKKDYPIVLSPKKVEPKIEDATIITNDNKKQNGRNKKA